MMSNPKNVDSIKVPSIPKLEYDSDTYYFDSKFTFMKIFEDDPDVPSLHMSDERKRDLSRLSSESTSTQSS
jgi:hypothetical protein